METRRLSLMTLISAIALAIAMLMIATPSTAQLPTISWPLDTAFKLTGDWTRTFFVKNTTAWEFSWITNDITQTMNITTLCPGMPSSLSTHWDACWWWGDSTYCAVSVNYFRLKIAGWTSQSAILSGWVGMPQTPDTILDYNATHSFWFKNDIYYGYSAADAPFSGYPRSIADWAGIPFNLDAALRQPWSGESWFFKGSQYWVYEPTYNRTLVGYPKSINPPADNTCSGEQDVGAIIGVFSDRRDKSGSYAQNLACSWRVTAPRLAWFNVLNGALYNGVAVQVTGLSFDSNADKIEIWEANDMGWDGKGTAPTQTLVASFDGTTSYATWSQVVYVSKNSHTWYVKFTTDGVSTTPLPGNGFNISYSVRNQAVNRIDAGNPLPRDPLLWLTSFRTTNSKVYVLDPGVQTPTSIYVRLYIDTYPLEANTPLRRNITIYRGNSTNINDFVYSVDTFLYSGPIIQGVTKLTIVLNNHDDSMISSIYGTAVISSTCNGQQTYTAIEGTVTDGSGTWNYFPSQTCQWLIQSTDIDSIVVLWTFDEFAIDNVGNSPDYLTFYNSTTFATSTNTQLGTYTGQAVPKEIISPISSMLMVFATGQNDNGAGFSGRYSIIFRPASSIITGLQPLLAAAGSGVIAGIGGELTVFPYDKYNRSVDTRYSGTYYNYYLRFIPTSLAASDISTLKTYAGSLSTASNTTAIGLLVQQLAIAKTPVYEFVPTDKDNIRRLQFTTPLTTGSYKVVLMMVCANTANPSSPFVEDHLNWPGSLTVVADKAYGPKSKAVVSNSSSVAGSNAYMRVLLYDQYGNALTHGNEDVRVFIVGATQNIFSVTTLTDFGNGTYLAKHTPTVAGDYKATVLVSGTDAEGSPVSLSVTALPTPQPENSIISVNTTVNQTLGVPVGTAVPFVVVPRDQYGNPTDATAVTISLVGTTDAGTLTIVRGPLTAAGQTFMITASEASVASLVATVGSTTLPAQLITFGTPASAPTAPLNVTGTGSDNQVRVSFLTPISDGGSPITLYTVTAEPGSIRATASASPITVLGLTNRVAYTFTVVATNARGNSPSSLPSGVIIPIAVSYDQPPAVIALIVVLALLIAITLFVAYVVWRTRNQVVIKTASPIFLILILFGGAMMYACAIMMAAYPPTSALCAVIPYVGHLAFAIAYGSLLAKTYRVGRIFTSDVLTVLRITNANLLGVVGAACLATVIYLAIWSASAPPTAILKVVDSKEYTVCQSSSSAWSWVIYLFEAAVLAWGMFLCFKNRHIPTLFNESFYISLGIYNLALIGLIVILLDRAKLVVSPDSLMLLQTIGMLVATTGTMALIFVPKINLLLLPDQEAQMRLKANGTVIGNSDMNRNSGIMRDPNNTTNTQLNGTRMGFEPTNNGKSVVMMSNNSPKAGQKWARPTDMRMSVAANNTVGAVNINPSPKYSDNNGSPQNKNRSGLGAAGDDAATGPKCPTCGQAVPRPMSPLTGREQATNRRATMDSSLNGSPALGAQAAGTSSFINLGHIQVGSNGNAAVMNAAPEGKQQSPNHGGGNKGAASNTSPPGTVFSGDNADETAIPIDNHSGASYHASRDVMSSGALARDNASIDA